MLPGAVVVAADVDRLVQHHTIAFDLAQFDAGRIPSIPLVEIKP